MSDVTRIIKAIERGEQKATDELLPLVYDELRQLAISKLSQEKPGQTLQATALVHEAYLRMVGKEQQEWDNSGHFFKAAAEAMRRILIENARRKKGPKHGGHLNRVIAEEIELPIQSPVEDLIALDEALTKLAIEEPQKAELVKLCYFGGLSIEQAATMLGLPRATAYRHWSYARAWLYNEIQGQ